MDADIVTKIDNVLFIVMLVYMYIMYICGGEPPSQFSRLGIQVSLAIYVCLPGLWLGGLPYLSFLSVFLKLACHVHVYTCFNEK